MRTGVALGSNMGNRGANLRRIRRERPQHCGGKTMQPVLDPRAKARRQIRGYPRSANTARRSAGRLVISPWIQR